MTVLMEGIVFGESPRWHDGRIWFSDWGAHQVIALDPDGGHEVIVSVPWGSQAVRNGYRAGSKSDPP